MGSFVLPNRSSSKQSHNPANHYTAKERLTPLWQMNRQDDRAHGHHHAVGLDQTVAGSGGKTTTEGTTIEIVAVVETFATVLETGTVAETEDEVTETEMVIGTAIDTEMDLGTGTGTEKGTTETEIIRATAMTIEEAQTDCGRLDEMTEILETRETARKTRPANPPQPQQPEAKK